MHKYYIYDIDSMLSDMDLKLVNKMCNNTHCINTLLPSTKSRVYSLRDRDHHFELPTWQSRLSRN